MKTKNTKNKSAKFSKRKAKHFESHYLALALVGFLLIEGFMFTATTRADWQQGLAVLDISQAVSQTTSDLVVVMQPMTDAIQGVNDFYSQAATAMMEVLDISDTQPLAEVSALTNGVNDFYTQAADQMSFLITTPQHVSWPHVAGISISAY